VSRPHHRRDESRHEPAPASFAVECPGCRTRLAVPRNRTGAGARCPTCGTAFLVPEPPPPLAPPAAPAPSEGPAEPLAALAASHVEPLVFSEPPLPSNRRLGAATVADPPVPFATSRTEDEEATPFAPPDTIADPPAMVAELAFREPAKTIRSGGEVIELYRLTPEERRLRRGRRNLLILVIGAAVLVALVVALT